MFDLSEIILGRWISESELGTMEQKEQKCLKRPLGAHLADLGAELWGWGHSWRGCAPASLPLGQMVSSLQGNVSWVSRSPGADSLLSQTIPINSWHPRPDELVPQWFHYLRTNKTALTLPRAGGDERWQVGSSPGAHTHPVEL